MGLDQIALPFPGGEDEVIDIAWLLKPPGDSARDGDPVGLSRLVIRLLLQDLFEVTQGQRDRPTMQAIGPARRQPDRRCGGAIGHHHFHRSDAFDHRAGKVDRHLRAPPRRHGDGRGGAGEITDAQAVPEVGPAAPHGVADLDQVFPRFLEQIGQARIGLQAGCVVVVSSRKLAATLRIEQGDLRIEGAAQAPAENFKADALARPDVDPVIIRDLGIRAAHDHARDRHALGSGARTIAVHLHDLRQLVNAEEPQVRHAVGRRQAQTVKAERCIARDVQLHT